MRSDSLCMLSISTKFSPGSLPLFTMWIPCVERVLLGKSTSINFSRWQDELNF